MNDETTKEIINKIYQTGVLVTLSQCIEKLDKAINRLYSKDTETDLLEFLYIRNAMVRSQKKLIKSGVRLNDE